jgi:hypothetical protein
MSAIVTFRLFLLLVLAGLGSATFAAEDEEENISVVPRKAEFSQKESWFFDVKVKNPTASDIQLPFLYDAVLEIDGALYTQFPKPKLSPEHAQQTVKSRSEIEHGTLTLNGIFETVDARTGNIPLKLAPGEHHLTVQLGPFRSSKIKFKLVE